jgi:hypothetical protein
LIPDKIKSEGMMCFKEEDCDMNRFAGLFIPIVLLSHPAAAGSAVGNSALALASLVSDQSPLLNLDEKSIMGQLLRPNPNFSWLASRKISVEADTIVCRQSNVDITARTCDLTFGSKTVTVKGRKAHELFATIAEVGVPPDGAAGTISESLSHLACAIDSNEIKQKSGAGAECTFESSAK